MHKFLDYKSIDFLNEDSFIKWIQKSDDEAVERWDYFVNNYPVKKRDIDEALEIYHSFKLNHESLSMEEIFVLWNKIKEPTPAKKGNVFITALKYAAIFIFIFGFGAVSYYVFEELSPDEFVLANDSMFHSDDAQIILADGKSVPLDQKDSKISYSSSGNRLVVNNDTINQNTKDDLVEIMNKVIIPYGKKSMITLSDGTKVWLNAGSQLLYPSRFLRKKREVLLVGEAFFEVVKNPERPFIVRTKEINVEVLGTSFDVSAYPDDNTFETTLVEGSVSLQIKNNGFLSTNENIVLVPNQRILINNSKGESVVKGVDVSFYTSWKDGMFKFEKEDLCKVVRKLERYYNIKIGIKDLVRLGSVKISGKLDLKNTPSDVLNVIQLIIPTTEWGKEENGDYYIKET